jgi:tetratricopeptide (TPR) repeat protein
MKHEGIVSHAAFSPDGRRIVTASKDKTARVWDAATGQPISTSMKHEDDVLHAVFSPDGRRIVTASADRTARVWDAATGQPISTSMRHEGIVSHAAFSPDGRRIVTASMDKTARVWDAATDQTIKPREDEAKDLISMAQLLSGIKVDRSGDLVPLTRDEVRAAWQELRPRYPDVFVCSPQEILSWHWREAAACENAKVWSWAVTHLDALIAAAPPSWMLLGRRARACARLGRWDEVIADASRAIALRPEQDQLWKLDGLWPLRGNAHAEQSRWQQAAADLTRAIEQDTANPDLQINLARVQLADGDTGRYRGACTRLIRDFGQSTDRNVANAVAWTCILAPEAALDREAVVRCARSAVKTAPKDSDKHRSLQTLGAATYRAGRYEEAIGHLNDTLKALTELGGPRLEIDPKAAGVVSSGPAPGGDALDWLFLSMAHHRLGHAEAARKWLDKAVTHIDRADQDPPDGTSPDSRLDWQTRLAYRVLRREAEGLIGGAGSGLPQPTATGGIVR